MDAAEQALAYVQRPGQGERVERPIPNIANEYEDWSLRWACQDLKDNEALVAIAMAQDVVVVIRAFARNVEGLVSRFNGSVGKGSA